MKSMTGRCHGRIILTDWDEERFWEKVSPDSESDCWLWLGDKVKGYGRMVIAGEYHAVHRVSWRIHFGDPGNREVLHECRQKLCVNPEHMRLGREVLSK